MRLAILAWIILAIAAAGGAWYAMQPQKRGGAWFWIAVCAVLLIAFAASFVMLGSSARISRSEPR